MKLATDLLVLAVLVCACTGPVAGGWLGGGKKADGAPEDASCRVHTDMVTPAALKKELPADEAALQTVEKARATIKDILDGKDQRLLVIVGPCSIHSYITAMEFGAKLNVLARKLSDDIVVVMRTYFEKPRTRLGWKGFINDPDLDGTSNMDKGVREARKVLLGINRLGMPCATEFVDPMVSSYISDLISWGSTGARTVDSQPHREMVSGLEMPVGMKHDVYGHVDQGMDAIIAASSPHVHLALAPDGTVSKVKTAGNKYAHLVLRGGGESRTDFKGQNYDERTLKDASARLHVFNMTNKVIVDCSHGNSDKKIDKQVEAVKAVLVHLQNEPIAVGSKVFPIAGVMLEANINEGKQEFPKTPEEALSLYHGVSLTDACLKFQDMENILNALAKANKQRREGTGKPTASPTEPQIDEKTRREMMAGTQNKVKGKIFDAFSKPQQKA